MKKEEEEERPRANLLGIFLIRPIPKTLPVYKIFFKIQPMT